MFHNLILVFCVSVPEEGHCHEATLPHTVATNPLAVAGAAIRLQLHLQDAHRALFNKSELPPQSCK